MNKSKRLENINFVCTILIVVLHCRVAPEKLFLDYPLYPHLYGLLGALGDAAVPTFFAISVFLFYRNYKQSLYVAKLKSRVKSLLVPYLIFSLISLIIFHAGKFIVYGEDKTTVIQYLKEFLLASNDSPIWFIRELFFFVLISPIIYEVVSRLNCVVVVLLALSSVILNIIFPQPYSSLQFWLPVIIMAALVSIRPNSIKNILLSNEGKLCSKVFWASTVLVFIIILLLVEGVSRQSMVYYIYRMIVPFFVFVISDCFSWKPLLIQRFTFFIFMTHYFPRLITLPLDSHPLYTPIRSLFALMFCIALGWLIERVWPKGWHIINGGRG